MSATPSKSQVTPGREKPWGTAQAVLCAADLIHEPFAMINADDFYGAPAFDVMAKYLSTGQDYAMVAYPLKSTLSDNGTVSRGLCDLDASGRPRLASKNASK